MPKILREENILSSTKTEVQKIDKIVAVYISDVVLCAYENNLLK